MTWTDSIRFVEVPDNESARELVAYGDESFSAPNAMPSVYLLGAVILERRIVPGVREKALGLRLPGQTKAHWYSDSNKQHDVAAAIIGGLSIASMVVVRLANRGEPDERRRRKCFERFAYELETRGCSHLTLESRGTVADSKDRAMVAAMQAQQTLRRLRIDHVRGKDEPLLWVADAVCGAVVAHRAGEFRWLIKIAHQLELIETIDMR